MGELSGKVALVTGGGRGQGRSHAVAFAEAGATVAICDVVEQDPAIPYPTGRPGDLDETVRLVEKAGGRCLAEVVDVRSLADVTAFTDRVVAELGSLDVLVAQAGVLAPAPIQDMTAESWNSVVDVCLTGVFNTIRAGAPHMIAQNSGRIIATSSGQGRTGAANMANYIAAKWGVIGLVKSAAMDLGPYNITVNAVLPGNIDTPMVRNAELRALFNPDLEDPTDEDLDRKIIELGWHTLPVGLIDPVEVSHAVLFLASDRAKYVSGGTIDVSAGWAAHHT